MIQRKKANEILKTILYSILAILFYIVFVFLGLIGISDAKFCDFFTAGEVSNIRKGLPGTTHNIIVDACTIGEQGGVKTLAENIIDGIGEKRPNWHFTILTCVDDPDFFKLKNKNVDVLKVSTCAYLSELIFARDLLNWCSFNNFRDQISQILFLGNIYFNKNSYDMIFDPYAEHMINDYTLPKVSLIHDLMYIDLPELIGFRGEVIKIAHENAPRIVDYSKKIITVSEYSRQRIIENYKVSNDFVKAIPIRLANRVKRSAIKKEEQQQLLHKFSLESKKYLIYTSIVRQHKNHMGLVEAFAKALVGHKISNIKLVIIGKISKEAIESLYRAIDKTTDNSDERIRIKKAVVFTSFVTNDELNVLLSNALAMIFPSLHEGFGMPVIEAMAAGIPVACSNVTSLPEVVGDAALLFDPYKTEEIENAIAQLVNDQKLREDLIQRGYKRAQYFSDTYAMIDEYIKIFEECMNEKVTKY